MFASPPIFLKLTVARLGVFERALVDTGTAITLIRADLARPLLHNMMIDSNPSFVTADGRRADCLGTLPLSVRHGLVEIDLDKVLVVPSLSYELIIGRDWLTKSRATIDFSCGVGRLIFPEARNPCFSISPSSNSEPSISLHHIVSVEPTISEGEERQAEGIADVDVLIDPQNLDPFNTRSGILCSVDAISSTSSNVNVDSFVDEEKQVVKRSDGVVFVNSTKFSVPKFSCEILSQVPEQICAMAKVGRKRIIDSFNRSLSLCCESILICDQNTSSSNSIVYRPVDRLLSRLWFPGIVVTNIKLVRKHLKVSPRQIVFSSRKTSYAEITERVTSNNGSASIISTFIFILFVVVVGFWPFGWFRRRMKNQGPGFLSFWSSDLLQLVSPHTEQDEALKRFDLC